MAKPNEKPTAYVRYFDEAYGGPGWYWWAAEYPEDGAVGAFKTSDEAVANATGDGYVALLLTGPPSCPVQNRAKAPVDESEMRHRVLMVLRMLSHRRGKWEAMRSDVDDILKAVRG